MSYEVNHPLKIDSNLNHLLYEVLNARVWHASYVTQIYIYTLRLDLLKSNKIANANYDEKSF